MFIDTRSHGYINSKKIRNINIEIFDLSDYIHPELYVLFDIDEKTESEISNAGEFVCLVAYVDGIEERVVLDWQRSHGRQDWTKICRDMSSRLRKLIAEINSHA